MADNLTRLQRASLLGPDQQDEAGRVFREERARRNLTPRQRASLLGPDQQEEAGRIFNEERNRSRGRGNRQTTPAPQENLPTVRRENLPAVQSGGAGGGGGGGGSRAIAPTGGERPPVPGGNAASRALAAVDNRIPINLRNAASTAASGAGHIAARGLGAVGLAADATPAAMASLTGTPEGRRILAEHEARRANDAAAGAAENYGRVNSTAPSATNPLNAEVNARRPRPSTRSNTRMSPRELTPDELHNISSLTLDPESGIAEMRGVRGEAARNIIARRAELEREPSEGMKRGGPVKKMAKGGVVSSSASSRSDGCVTKGRTKGRVV